jgi:hypothetical protein
MLQLKRRKGTSTTMGEQLTSWESSFLDRNAAIRGYQPKGPEAEQEEMPEPPVGRASASPKPPDETSLPERDDP